MTILPATQPTQLLAARRLFEEYAASLSFDLCFQNFRHELDTLPGEYAPPGGGLWLATTDSGEAAGCVALRRLETDIGEMKRLYVRPAHRGTGLGRRLIKTVVTEAAAAGYARLRLDTTPEMAAAIRLYEAMGFVRIPPYRPNPVAGVIYLELALGRAADERVSLRPVEPGDLPRMYEMQLDPASNRMAVTIPRTREAFDAHWAKILDDPGNTARAVLLDGQVVGYISCFPADGRDHVGYWIDRAHWGQGLASRALHLLLGEVTTRPLVATAATGNGASLRVLQKCGFVIEEVRHSPATERYPECEEAVLVLR